MQLPLNYLGRDISRYHGLLSYCQREGSMREGKLRLVASVTLRVAITSTSRHWRVNRGLGTLYHALATP